MPQIHLSPRAFLPGKPKIFGNASLLRRLCCFLLPVPLVILTGIFLITHNEVGGTLDRAIARNSSIMAEAMGFAMTQTLRETRNQTASLAAGSASLSELEHRLNRRLETLTSLGDKRFSEAAIIGIGAQGGFRRLWIVQGGRMLSIPSAQLDSQTGSPFSFSTRLPKENEVSLSAPTEVTYSFISGEDRKQTQLTLHVVRFTTLVTLTDGTAAGYLVISLNLSYLNDAVTTFSLSAADEGQQPMPALFVDHDGWMIFQTRPSLSTSRKSAIIDSVRAGFRGDFGRAGFSQAFRPEADYYGYWTMMNDITQNRSGQFATRDVPWNQGMPTVEIVSYAPVTYATGESGTSEVIGGMVVLDPTFGSTKQGGALQAVCLTACLACLLLMSAACWWIASHLSRSLKSLRREIQTAAGQSLAPVLPAQAEEPREVAQLRDSVNSLLKLLRGLEEERDKEYTLASARLQMEEVTSMPVSIPQPEDGIIGVSREIAQLRQEILQAARVDADVLIMGETGTGKELVSRAIHRLSARKDGPFITINCGALDEGLLMDTLFGHVKGAYTEARQARKGAFLTAEGGTLMLDEVGTASPKVQQALLRALSDRCILPLGSDTPVPFSTRVIAATNAELKEAIQTGSFREDLYFRLAVIVIRTPPLRFHKSDIPYLVMAFLQEAVAKSPEPRRMPGISRGALSRIMHYDWPGNVRELYNTILSAEAFCEGDLILPQHLPLGAQQNKNSLPEPAAQAKAAGALPQNSGDQNREAAGNGRGGRKNPARSREQEEGENGEETPASRQPLSARLRRILPKLMERGEVTRQSYQEMAGISARTALYDLQELAAAGYVVREGKGPSQKYVCTGKRPDDEA